MFNLPERLGPNLRNRLVKLGFQLVCQRIVNSHFPKASSGSCALKDGLVNIEYKLGRQSPYCRRNSANTAGGFREADYREQRCMSIVFSQGQQNACSAARVAGIQERKAPAESWLQVRKCNPYQAVSRAIDIY